jgi:hypothetical protein
MPYSTLRTRSRTHVRNAGCAGTEREEQLSKCRHVQDAAGLAAGAHGLNEPHLAGVGIGSRATASTGVGKGSGLEDLLWPSHLAPEVT